MRVRIAVPNIGARSGDFGVWRKLLADDRTANRRVRLTPDDR